MYKILYKGDILAYCEEPNYVKIADNGCYNSCSRDEAIGIAVHSIVYQLDQVVVGEADVGAMAENFTKQGEDLLDVQEVVINQAVDSSLTSLGVEE